MRMALYRLRYKISRFQRDIEWLVYLITKKQCPYPCGRTKKDKYLCCRQPWDRRRMYLSDDKHAAYCKVCGTIRGFSSTPINFDDPSWEEI